MSKLLKRLNDNQNKVADTNGIMKLQAWDDGVAQDLTNKHITATVANASGFLFDLDLVSNGTEIDLDFKDSQLQKLTPDTYFLEIKVTDEAGDISVFPTEGYATFTINKNLHATEGALVPQITFDTVLADVKTAMDKKVADYVKTIAKGGKGDTGPQGPQGIQGKQGLKGDKGDTGPTGATGANGKDGVVDYSKTVNITGDQIIVGDKTYMGTNTFMDGVSLNGKNKVNNLTDTDWLDIPLAEGRTGNAKYKVSLGKVFVHLDMVKGITAEGNNNKGQIGTLPVNPSPYYTRHIGQAGSTARGITINPAGVIYVANAMGSTMSKDDLYVLDIVLI